MLDGPSIHVVGYQLTDVPTGAAGMIGRLTADATSPVENLARICLVGNGVDTRKTLDVVRTVDVARIGVRVRRGDLCYSRCTVVSEVLNQALRLSGRRGTLTSRRSAKVIVVLRRRGVAIRIGHSGWISIGVAAVVAVRERIPVSDIGLVPQMIACESQRSVRVVTVLIFHRFTGRVVRIGKIVTEDQYEIATTRSEINVERAVMLNRILCCRD